MTDISTQKEYRKMLVDLITRKLPKLGLKELREVYTVVCGLVDKEKSSSS